MPNSEPSVTTQPNQLHRFAIGTASPSPILYSLAEFWTLYKSTFKPQWNAEGVTYGSPRDTTVTLISPWAEIQVYPLPASIGKTHRAKLATHRQCCECNKWLAPDGVESLTVDSIIGLYCADCKDGLHTCEHCDELCTDTYPVVVDSWCESCRDNHAIRCDDCRDYYPEGSDGLSHRHDWYCESCAENYSTCDGCGTLLSEDNQYSDSHGDGTYCEGCRPSDNDDDSDNEYIHNYGHKPKPIFHGSGIHYGVELEITCDRDTAEDTIDTLGGDSHVYLKDDSSISGGGYEIVTHPHTLAEQRALWAPFNDFARRKGFKANGNGMHVHIERSKLTPYRIAIMQRFMNREDNHGFIAAIAQRDTASWAKCDAELGKGMHCRGNGARYSALNLTNTKTVEIRIFRGTIRKSEFTKNLEFCDALVQWSVDRSHASTSVADFTAWVRKSRKTYPALDAFLVEHKYLPAIKTDTRVKEVPTCA